MIKYIKFLTIVFLVFHAGQLFSQTTKNISGKVTDEKGAPLFQAIVSSDEGDVFTLTDKEGKFSLTILFSPVVLVEKDGFNTKQLSITEVSANSSIVLEKPDFLMGEKDLLQLPFRQLAAKRSVGSATVIDVEEHRSFDSRQGLDAALNGRVAGLYGSKNIWGRGNSVVVIDGFPRTDDYDVNLLEIESITVLKDPVSRALYGAMANQGVIMVKTKRGKAYKKVLNFQAETGVSQPIENTFPKFMNAADYMNTVNSIDPSKPVYSVQKIEDTRNGINPALNPDNDFYSSEFIQPQTEFHSIAGESSGGNKAAQYYLNLGWQHNNGWMKLGDRETTDKLNLRGNVDYQIAENFKMNLDAGALVNIMKSSNISDYWKTASTVLPNAYPLYWDPSIITKDSLRNSILETGSLLPNGMLVGGNQVNTTNFYGDIFKKGDRVVWERNLQVNIGADWDLKFLLPGLKAKGSLAIDAYNVLVKGQSGKYAVYNPQLVKGTDTITVTKIGEDQKVSNFAPVGDDMAFHRRIGMYANLAYDKTFGKTDVSLLAVAYRDQLAKKLPKPDGKPEIALKQEERNLTFGLNGNIMHNSKYLLDFSLGLLGSQKLLQENRLAFTPSLGLGWIVSEEDFMANSEIFDYLKVRANAGILKNDNWSDYWLHTSAYETGSAFTYNNGSNRNEERKFINFGSNIGWQKRKELTIGFDASMFENKLWMESSLFYTESFDNVTEFKELYPLLLGTNAKKYFGNLDADRIKGIDFGLKYNAKIAKDISFSFGGNIVLKAEKILNRDEPNYINDYQFRVGTRTNSHWGLASDGLYGADDFGTDGKLISNLPVPGWGAVTAGDIKYIDWNGDDKINSEDEHIIGKQGSDFQYSIHFNLKIKQFELYAIGIGSTGGNNLRNNDYYRTYGTVLKYPEHLKQAYSASNTNVNALYPRLTSNSSSHNFRTSDFWMYSSTSFSIPTIQLTYNFEGKPTSVVKNARIYLKGSNLIRYNANPQFANLSLNSAPKTYSFSVGSIFTF